MMRIHPGRHGLRAIGFGLAGAALYALMINGTLAHIQAVSGMVPFDMRPLGYSPKEAADLLGGLGEAGRRYYLTRQIPLDTVYPALLAITLVSAICGFGARLRWRKFVRAGLVCSVAAAVFDYAENLGIVAMIWGWSDLPGALVYASSGATIAKSCLTSIAVLIAVFLGVSWIWRTGRDFRQ